MVGQADPIAIQRCVEIISQTDFSEKLKRLRESTIPVMCIYGTEDVGMPYEASTKPVKELMPSVEVKLYDHAAHGSYLPLLVSVC